MLKQLYTIYNDCRSLMYLSALKENTKSYQSILNICDTTKNNIEHFIKQQAKMVTDKIHSKIANLGYSFVNIYSFINESIQICIHKHKIYDTNTNDLFDAYMKLREDNIDDIIQKFHMMNLSYRQQAIQNFALIQEQFQYQDLVMVEDATYITIQLPPAVAKVNYFSKSYVHVLFMDATVEYIQQQCNELMQKAKFETATYRYKLLGDLMNTASEGFNIDQKYLKLIIRTDEKFNIEQGHFGIQYRYLPLHQRIFTDAFQQIYAAYFFKRSSLFQVIINNYFYIIDANVDIKYNDNVYRLYLVKWAKHKTLFVVTYNNYKISTRLQRKIINSVQLDKKSIYQKYMNIYLDNTQNVVKIQQ